MTLACTAALAQAPASKGAPAAGSTEAQVAARFAERSGGSKPDQVFKGQAGLFEVLIGGELYYVDANVNFVIAGTMFDSRTRENLTQKRIDTALKVDFKSLPFDRAIKTTRGNGSRTIVTFEDPNCQYCKRLWQTMGDLKDVTIYTFLYPIDQLHPDSARKSKMIWCSPDRIKAWDEFFASGKLPDNKGECDNPLQATHALGEKLRVSATPTLVFADGSIIPGALPRDRLEAELAKAATEARKTATAPN
jgi:thiol:disulfide interchange protein DsbC